MKNSRCIDALVLSDSQLPQLGIITLILGQMRHIPALRCLLSDQSFFVLGGYSSEMHLALG